MVKALTAQLLVATCAAALLAAPGVHADASLRQEADQYINRDCKVSAWKYGLCEPTTGKQSRDRIIITTAKGNGVKCPTLLSESIDCAVDCVLDWEPWGAGNDVCDKTTGLRTRKQVVAVAPLNKGLPCPVAATQSEPCAVDCETSVVWSSCDKTTGLETATQKVTVAAKNGGAACPALGTQQTRNCKVSCELYYPPWDWATHACNPSTHKRTRTQVVKIEEKNGGTPCDPPTTEDIDCDVDCVMGYDSWSTDPADCDVQTGLIERTQKEVISKWGTTGATCPAPETEYKKCSVDCVAEYSADWTPCDKTTGTQSKTQYIAVTAKNGGTPCGTLQSLTQKCDVPCEMKFPDWDPLVHQCNKTTGQRVRFQQPVVLPKNSAAACPVPKRDVMECPVSCELKLPEWSAVLHPCDPVTGLQTRTQVVAFAAKNGGSACPPLQSETRKCVVDCELAYPDWATATCNKATGLQTVTQYQVSAPKNGGKACPAAQSKTQTCTVDCEVKFADWDPTLHLCNKTTGFRTRTEIVDVTQKNGGKACPTTLATGALACSVDCELAWPAWNATLHVCDKATGRRTRTQIPSVLPKNGGLNCPTPLTETQNCPVDCETAFPDWDSIPCQVTNTKTRAQYAAVTPKNGGAECKYKTPEVTMCQYISGGSGNIASGGFPGVPGLPYWYGSRV